MSKVTQLVWTGPLLIALACCDSDTATSRAPADDLESMTPVCSDMSWAPGPCVAPTLLEVASTTAAHVDPAEPITYDASPPSSGPHRPAWAKWGEYDYLPPHRWLHNLEHGGVAFLYHPCADAALIAALRAIAAGRSADDGGRFRYVLTPYPDLPSAIAVMAWEHHYAAECVSDTDVQAFIDANYRKAPEDVPSDGPYEMGWQRY